MEGMQGGTRLGYHPLLLFPPDKGLTSVKIQFCRAIRSEMQQVWTFSQIGHFLLTQPIDRKEETG